MIRFECDYGEGAHPLILERLAATNMEQTAGYGEDPHCEAARGYIRELCRMPDADVHFLVGGTQANLAVIAAALRPHQGVIAAESGHINVHETGAVEATGHKVITVAGEAEGGRRPVEEINNDIAAIDRLLRENKDKIASLQRSAALLRKSNLRIESLEKMIADMNAQLGEKSAEVDRLRERLAQMGVEVESLSQEVAVRSAEVENLSGEKIELQNQLNTVYYIVGPEKELRDAQIINKQGFIGRTLTVGRTGNLDSFTAADSRLLSEIPVGQKRASVVTSHPEDSYQLVTAGDKVVEKLVITDPVRFWETSKVLIISYK